MCLRKQLAVILVILLLAISATNCSPSTVQNTKATHQKPSIISFEANPPEINKGSATTLTWNVIGATKVIFDQKIGDVQSSGKVSVTPDTTTTYSLTASNNSGSVSQSITVKVNQANPVIQPISELDTTQYIATTPQSQTFCRDGLCTFINGSLYSIDYPDTWKVNDPGSAGSKTVELAPIDAVYYSSGISIDTTDAIGQTLISQVADQLVKSARAGSDPSFYVADNRAMTGAWDWFISWSFHMVGATRHVRVYYKNTTSHLYILRAYAEQSGYQAVNPFANDFDKIINSFKLLQ